MKFAFTSKNGSCPECRAFGRRWYIMDRNLYYDKYEHCLMSVTLEPQPKYQFRDKVELASWLNGFTNYQERDPWWTDHFISRYIKTDYSDMALIVKDGVQYRYEKEKNLLVVLPEHRRESCWYDSYRECLTDAKELLQKMSKTYEPDSLPA